jgi:limonene-1,2-epoxide hydrolase
VSQGPSPEIEVVRSFLKALEAMDLDMALSYLSPTVEYQNMPIPAVRGHGGVRRILGPVARLTGFEAHIDKIASNGPTVLTERTDAIIIGPVRIPFHVCGTFEVRDGQIAVWRDTFDYASALVNTIIAGPLYAFRRVAMTLALKAAARKA